MPQIRSAAATSAKNAIPSLLSADIRIKGDVRSSGEIQIDGVVEGDVVTESLVVSEVGTVRGTIVARTVRVLGTVAGTINASSIRLTRSARVTGDIVHEALSIEEGAYILGHCRRAEPHQPATAEGERANETAPDVSAPDVLAPDVSAPDVSASDSAGASVPTRELMMPIVVDGEDGAIAEEGLTIPAPAR